MYIYIILYIFISLMYYISLIYIPCRRDGCPGKKGDLLPWYPGRWQRHPSTTVPPWELIAAVTPLFSSNWMLLPKQLPRCLQEDFTVEKQTKKTNLKV